MRDDIITDRGSRVAILDVNSHIKESEIDDIFWLLFDCPSANFGLLSWGQHHSPDVNHCVSQLPGAF